MSKSEKYCGRSQDLYSRADRLKDQNLRQMPQVLGFEIRTEQGNGLVHDTWSSVLEQLKRNDFSDR